MTDPVTSTGPGGPALPQLVRLLAQDAPTDWSWIGPDARASLNTAVPMAEADQVPALLTRPGVQMWGVYVADRLQGVYLCSDHAQHHVTRVSYAPAPQASGLWLLEHTFGQLTETLLSAGAQKVSVHLFAGMIRRLWPLFRLNKRFFLEGRLRQEWQPALQRNEDVFIISALAQESMRPEPGTLWLNTHARTSGQRFFSSWATSQASAPLPETNARGSTLVDTAEYQLRTLAAKDVNETLVGLLNSPQLVGSMNLPRFTFNLPSSRALLASFDRNFNQFIGIFKRTDGELIGFYTVLVNERARQAHLALGIHSSEAAASRVMVDTITPLTDSYFERFAIQKIIGNVLVSNRRMLLSLSHNYTFLFEAVLRQECVSDQGRLDVVVFSTFRDLALRPRLGRLTPVRGEA
ncbi:MAG: hypothetical protein I8H77_04775 [Comamonadaceae bacterium]|nr:hypothetical protein [Comamonadaceae bacterium]